MRALPSTTRTATCETCGSVHDVSTPTPGFRCESCIVADSDASARRTRHRALALFAGGAILLAIAALLWMVRFDDNPLERTTPLPLYIGFAGIGMFGIGAGMLRYRPRLKLD